MLTRLSVTDFFYKLPETNMRAKYIGQISDTASKNLRYTGMLSVKYAINIRPKTQGSKGTVLLYLFA